MRGVRISIGVREGERERERERERDQGNKKDAEKLQREAVLNNNQPLSYRVTL